MSSKVQILTNCLFWVVILLAMIFGDLIWQYNPKNSIVVAMICFAMLDFYIFHYREKDNEE